MKLWNKNVWFSDTYVRPQRWCILCRECHSTIRICTHKCSQQPFPRSYTLYHSIRKNNLSSCFPLIHTCGPLFPRNQNFHRSCKSLEILESKREIVFWLFSIDFWCVWVISCDPNHCFDVCFSWKQNSLISSEQEPLTFPPCRNVDSKKLPWRPSCRQVSDVEPHQRSKGDSTNRFAWRMTLTFHDICTASSCGEDSPVKNRIAIKAIWFAICD